MKPRDLWVFLQRIRELLFFYLSHVVEKLYLLIADISTDVKWICLTSYCMLIDADIGSYLMMAETVIS